MREDAVPETQVLIEELLALPPQDLERTVLSEAKYRTIDTGLGLARHAAALQGVDAGRCAGLATAALWCLTALPLAAAPQDVRQRVRALAGNARRLLGEPRQAAFEITGLSAEPTTGNGEYLRVLALVRWEQGLVAEAVALLARAETHLRAEGLAVEARATRQLRVLLHAEAGEDGEALRLYANTGAADPGDRPWLKARAACTAAFGFAARPGAEARKAARTALANGGTFAALVTGEPERLRLQWLAARAEARLEGGREAKTALAGLREQFLHRCPWIDVVLLTLDVFAARTPAGKGLDLFAVEADLRHSAPAHEDLDRAGAVFLLARTLVPGLGPWETADFAGRTARHVFRLGGCPATPIPFLLPWPGIRA